MIDLQRTTGYNPEHPNSIDKPEQPNQNIIIVKTIQQLTHVISNELAKLSFDSKTGVIIAKAIEDINLFERTTLYELQKVFE